MKVTIDDLSKRLADIVGLDFKVAKDSVKSLFTIMSEELGNGNDIVMTNAFNLEVYQHKAKRVRNPITNEPLEMKTFKKVRFKPCLRLREKINES